MKSKVAVVESMTRIIHKSGAIRVWRAEVEVRCDYPESRDEIKEEYRQARIGHLDATIEEIIDRLLALPRINAIEYIDEYRNGAVFYPTWP